MKRDSYQTTVTKLLAPSLSSLDLDLDLDPRPVLYTLYLNPYELLPNKPVPANLVPNNARHV